MVTNFTFHAYVCISVESPVFFLKCQSRTFKKYPFVNLHIILSGSVGCGSRFVIKLIGNSSGNQTNIKCEKLSNTVTSKCQS